MSTSLPGRFCLEGQFLSFIPGRKSPYQYLALTTPTGPVQIKLRKSLRTMLFRHLTAGDLIRVVGKQKPNKERDGICLKATEVMVLPSRQDGALRPQTLPTEAIAVSATQQQPRPNQPPDHQPPVPPKKSGKASKAKVLVCQKSACRKRGSQQVYHQLAQTLDQKGLGNQVKLVATGCMDRCKKGPHVVVMPAKARYSGVSPRKVEALVQEHFDCI